MHSMSSIPRTSTDASASALVSLVDGSNAPADSDFPELPAPSTGPIDDVDEYSSGINDNNNAMYDDATSSDSDYSDHSSKSLSSEFEMPTSFQVDCATNSESDDR